MLFSLQITEISQISSLNWTKLPFSSHEGRPALTTFLDWSKERFFMSSAINASFPQPPLIVPQSLLAVKTPISDPDSSSNIPISVTKIKTTAEISAKAPRQAGLGAVQLKA
jgi:hypothetical protein